MDLFLKWFLFDVFYVEKYGNNPLDYFGTSVVRYTIYSMNVIYFDMYGTSI